jgi:hypothetical protein
MFVSAALGSRQAPLTGALLFVIYLPFAYAGAIICGLPVHLVLRRHGLTSWGYYAVCGVIIAAFVATVWLRTSQFSLWGDHGASDWPAISSAGLASALVFRAIVGPESNSRLQRTALRAAADPKR